MFKSAFVWSPWGGHDGENVYAECAHDGPGGCGWEFGPSTLRKASRAAEDHAVSAEHSVMVERTLSRFVAPRALVEEID